MVLRNRGGGGTGISGTVRLRGTYSATVTDYVAGDGVRDTDGVIWVATANVPTGTAPPASPWGRWSGPQGPLPDLSAYAKLNGATFTGNVVVPTPDALFEAVHKEYADALVNPVVFNVSDNAALGRIMLNARNSTQPLWVYATASVQATAAGTSLGFSANDLIYFPPRNIRGQRIVNIPGGDNTGGGNPLTTLEFDVGKQTLTATLQDGTEVPADLSSVVVESELANAVNPRVSFVGNNNNLAGSLANQGTNSRPIWIIARADVRADIGGQTVALSNGDVAYFPPRSLVGIVPFNLLEIVKAESEARVKGDDLQVRTISSAAQLITFLNAQTASDSPFIVHFTIDVTEVFNGETHAFKTDDVVYFPPRSVVSKTIPLPEPNVGGNIGIVPKNIADVASLDGDYVLGVAALDVAHLKRLGVDQYEIWFKDESVHTVSSWTPVADFAVAFNVSTAEETQIGLTGTDRIVPVRLVFRNSGTFVDWVATFLTIGDDKSGDAADLTDIEKALNLGAYLETPVVARTSAAIQGPWRINFDNPTALPNSGYWFTIDVEGQPATEGRVAWAQASSASFTIASGVAEAIIQGAGTKRVVELNLYFYTAAAGRASDYVARLRYGVAFLTPKAPNILQVAVDGGDTAGAASVVLPANYADWKHLQIALWEINEDKIVTITIPTAVIEAQTVNRNIRVDAGRSDNRSAELTWTRTTRTIASADRIIFAELTDD